jgi:hypothetical protein
MVCLEALEPGVQHETGVHPLCDGYGPEIEATNRHLVQTLTEIIRWADENSPRSLQAQIGPSELGTPCDRKLAYKLANNREINKRRDPWPAIVGTGIHHWLEGAVNRFQEHYGLATYLTEQERAGCPACMSGPTSIDQRSRSALWLGCTRSAGA